MIDNEICGRDKFSTCGVNGSYCNECPFKPYAYSKNMNLINSTGFQSCPVCLGTGISQNAGTYNEIPICTVCNGKKIISVTTGHPPI